MQMNLSNAMFRMKLLLIFLSGFVFTLACGFYIDTSNLLSRYFSLQERHQAARQKLMFQKQSLRSGKDKHNPLQIDTLEWNRVIMQLSDAGLQVRSITREDVDYHVVLEGDYKELFHWLSQCSCEVRGIRLLENPQNIHAEITFSMHDSESDIVVKENGLDPFCGGAGQAVGFMNMDKFTLQELRPVGIANRGGKEYALIQLPDASIVEKPVGAKIAGGLILAVQNGSLTLDMPDQTKRVVKIDGN